MQTVAMQYPKIEAEMIVMTRPQPLAIDAYALEQIVEDYFRFKEHEGKIRPTTITNYRIHLKPFLDFWRECSDVHQWQLSQEMLSTAAEWIKSEWRNSQGEKPHPTTVFNCFTRVRGILNWAYEAGCTGGINAATWCPSVRRKTSMLYFPTVDELSKVMESPTDINRIRDVAIMAFLLSTGARLFETAKATVGNLHFNTPCTNIKMGDNHAGFCHLIQTKGDRDGYSPGRYVVFCSNAGLLLKCHLRTVKRTSSDSIFGLTDGAIGHIVKRHAALCKLPEISPHAFRRAFSDYWDEYHGMKGRSLLKKQLGHSDDEDVTQKYYINRNPQRIVRDLMKSHVSPLSQINIDWTSFPVHIENMS